MVMSKVKFVMCEAYDVVKTSLVLFGMIFLSAVVISTPIIAMQAAVIWLDGSL
jgi:hypothetical protein